MQQITQLLPHGVWRKFYMVSGYHDSSYKDECLLGCNSVKTDTSIMIFQRNLLPDHTASHHSRRNLPCKGYTWVTREVQTQIYKQVHIQEHNTSIHFSKPPQNLKTQISILTVSWLSQAVSQSVSPFLHWISGFIPRLVQEGKMVDEGSLGHAFSGYLGYLG